jgi:hypothetical protein
MSELCFIENTGKVVDLSGYTTLSDTGMKAHYDSCGYYGEQRTRIIRKDDVFYEVIEEAPPPKRIPKNWIGKVLIWFIGERPDSVTRKHSIRCYQRKWYEVTNDLRRAGMPLEQLAAFITEMEKWERNR